MNLFTEKYKEWELKSLEILTEKSDFIITVSNLEFYAWPQTFCGTNPFGAGGNSMTDHTIICFRNTLYNDCVLWLNDIFRYEERFKPFIKYVV